MKIRVLFHSEAGDTPSVREAYFEVPEDATIQDLLQISGQGEMADLSGYYPLSASGWGDNYVPYLFVNGKASYGVLFQDAKITDFLNTHQITDHTIRVAVAFPMAGGRGPDELLDLWKHIYPVLEQIAVVCSLTGFNLGSLLGYLKRHFIKKKQGPQVCFEIVLSRKQWNSLELATLLDLDPDKAKELLRLCDYRYDRSQMQYLQGEHAAEIKEKLMHAEIRG